jgi:hypothetical protein
MAFPVRCVQLVWIPALLVRGSEPFGGWGLNARGRKRLLLLEGVSGRKTRFQMVRSPFSMKKGFIQGLDIIWNGQEQL